MQKDTRDLLDVLKFELQVLERGGYGSSPREPWRQHLAFEDSPSCMNYDANENPAPCEECILMQLVPPAQRGAKIPCRHIPLTKEGETLECLYRCGTQLEIEDTMELVAEHHPADRVTESSCRDGSRLVRLKA